MSVADLILDPEMQCREGVDEATVRRYATAMGNGAEFPAIGVALVDGVPFVVDGWHRVKAHAAARQSA